MMRLASSLAPANAFPLKVEIVGYKTNIRANRRAVLVRCLSSMLSQVRILTKLDFGVGPG